MSETAPDPKLSDLEPLLGEWEMEAVVDGGTVMRGRATYAWADQGPFLVQTADGEATSDLWEGHLPFPTISIIGLDDALDTYSVLYSDARGVLRVYAMTFTDGVLTQWRDAPDFNQRFTGELHDGGSRIDARWDRRADDEDWALDFEITYTRV